jgi:two-component system, response regulator PdtaR
MDAERCAAEGVLTVGIFRISIMGDGHRSTVLVVDDEALVRLDIVESLNAAGYATQDASCAEEAIQMLEQDPGIRVVFTDIQMPGSMDGLTLSHYVRKRWPPTAIVIVSGKSNIAPDDLPMDADFLAKPFSGLELTRILNKVELRLSS